MQKTNLLYRTSFSAILLALFFFIYLPYSASALPPHGEVRPASWATLINPQMNLYKIDDLLYRSEQPNKLDIEELKALNIKTVINLRGFHSDESIFKDSGITLIRVPIHTWHIRDRHIIRALNAIQGARENGPVLIHCLHGADRTGLISAMYRVIFQGWDKKSALDELKNGGYGYHSIWTNIPRYFNKVNIENIKTQLDQRP